MNETCIIISDFSIKNLIPEKYGYHEQSSENEVDCGWGEMRQMVEGENKIEIWKYQPNERIWVKDIYT